MNPGINQRLIRRDIFIRRGDTYTEDYFLTDSSGAPLDVTNFTFLSQIRSSADSDVVLVTFTWTKVDAAGGHVRRSLDAVTTAALDTITNKIGDNDAQYTDGAGNVTTFDACNVFFESDVSRP